MRGRGGIISGIITLIIGGAVYNISQTDVVNNFAQDTGLSVEQAERYVESISEQEDVPWDELGDSFIEDGEFILDVASQIDCVNYEYDWETTSLTCAKGKAQMNTIGRSEIALGESYRKLSLESATTSDISATIRAISKLNVELDSEVVSAILDYATIDELKKVNSYNKALLQAALDSE